MARAARRFGIGGVLRSRVKTASLANPASGKKASDASKPKSWRPIKKNAEAERPRYSYNGNVGRTTLKRAICAIVNAETRGVKIKYARPIKFSGNLKTLDFEEAQRRLATGGGGNVKKRRGTSRRED